MIMIGAVTEREKTLLPVRKFDFLWDREIVVHNPATHLLLAM